MGVEVEKVSGMLGPTVVKSLTQIPAQPRVTHITPTQIHKYKYRHIQIHKYQLNSESPILLQHKLKQYNYTKLQYSAPIL